MAPQPTTLTAPPLKNTGCGRARHGRRSSQVRVSIIHCDDENDVVTVTKGWKKWGDEARCLAASDRVTNAERVLAAGLFANVPRQWEWEHRRCIDSESLNSLPGDGKIIYQSPSIKVKVDVHYGPGVKVKEECKGEDIRNDWEERKLSHRFARLLKPSTTVPDSAPPLYRRRNEFLIWHGQGVE
ncbi:hypothetical protein B0H19DRAFT_1063005 [Mycena capillaripes]|nr:hypothetical protein B0H19DRAFT_1063005 [Mycena capillaripes]